MGFLSFLFSKENEDTEQVVSMMTSIQEDLVSIKQTNDAIKIRLSRIENSISGLPTIEMISELLKHFSNQFHNSVKKELKQYDHLREIGNNELSKKVEGVTSELKIHHCKTTNVISAIKTFLESKKTEENILSAVKSGDDKIVSIVKTGIDSLDSKIKQLDREDIDVSSLLEEFSKIIQDRLNLEENVAELKKLLDLRNQAETDVEIAPEKRSNFKKPRRS